MPRPKERRRRRNRRAPERWIVAAGLAGAVAAAYLWGVLNAWFALPLFLALALVGVGFSTRRLEGELTEAEETRGSLIGEIEALTEESGRRIRELRTLYESSMAATQSTGGSSLAASLAEDARQIVGADIGCVFLTGEGRITEVCQVGDGDCDRFRLEVGDEIAPGGLAAHLADRGGPVVLSDAKQDPRFAEALEVRETRMGSVLALPLSSADRVLGGLLLGASAEGSFTGEEVRVLTILANLAAAAMEKARFTGELGRRIQALEKENRQLGRVEGLRARLVSRLARELTEPLRTLDTLMDLLEAAGEGAGLRLRRPLCDAMRAEMRRALRVARETAGAGDPVVEGGFRWSEESLIDLLCDAAVEHTAAAVRRSVLIQPPSGSDPVVVSCDRALAGEALGLVIEHLAEGVREGSVLAISVERHPGAVHVVFGAEASEGFIESLYRGLDRSVPFVVEGDAAADLRNLRLALARSAVDLHGGALRLEPRMGGAFQVRIALPAGQGVKAVAPEVLQEIARGSSLRGMLEVMAALVADLLGVRRVALMLADAEREELFVQATWGMDEVEAKHLRVAAGQGLVGEAAARGVPCTGRAEDPEPRAAAAGAATGGPASRLAVPIRWGAHTVGVLDLVGKVDGGPFGESDIHLAQHVASVAARALSREKDADSVRQDLVEALSTMASVAGVSSTQPAGGVTESPREPGSRDTEELPC